MKRLPEEKQPCREQIDHLELYLRQSCSRVQARKALQAYIRRGETWTRNITHHENRRVNPKHNTISGSSQQSFDGCIQSPEPSIRDTNHNSTTSEQA